MSRPHGKPSGGGASEGAWIWGLHSIEACVENFPELVLEVVVESDLAPALRKSLQEILKEAGLSFKDQKKLPGFLAEKRTQGVAARLKGFPQTDYSDFESEFVDDLQAGKAKRWAVLDSIQDPRNYGAVIRSAAAFGISAVVTGRRDQCPITGVVAQASAGNVFRVPNVEASNLSRVLERAKSEGAHILALDGQGRELPEVLRGKETQPIVWVLGSEGEGLRAGLKSQVTELVRIPMCAGVESLNASVAAAIAFYATYSPSVGA